MNKSTSHGFTLIELMITVAIVGILASIAVPSYLGYVVKGRRAEARTALTELMQQQERYLTQSNKYLAFTTNAAGVPTPAAPFKTFSGDTLANSSYLLSAEVCTGILITECVQVKATPIKADAEAGALTMTSTGTKSCDGTKPSVCWK